MDDLTKSLNQMPADRESIRNAAEQIGRSLGQKAAQAGINRNDLEASFRQGLESQATEASTTRR